MLNVIADVPVMAAADLRVLRAINRPALERTKSILAETCFRNAALGIEVEHMLGVAAIAPRCVVS